MSPAQRDKLASDAGIKPGYLYQIATRWRGKRPSIQLMQRLAHADRKLTLADMVAEFAEPAAKAQEAA